MADPTFAVVALLAGANWEVDPLYVDAFLDRGKRGKEPRLHLMHLNGDGITPYAFSETIDQPGSTAWIGFRDRPSTLMLAGRMSMHGALPFTDPHRPLVSVIPEYDLLRWAMQHLSPKERAWGRETAGLVERNGWWYSQEGAFFLPKAVGKLPRVRDVLADPPKDAPWNPADLRAALKDVAPDLRAEARLTVATAIDTHAQSTAHQRMATTLGVRDALATALQYTLHLRTFGRGRAASPGSSIVPNPVWVGDIVFPSH